jgi:hypothetical protein
MIASEAEANITSVSVIAPTPLYNIDLVGENESDNASTEPSTSPLKLRSTL